MKPSAVASLAAIGAVLVLGVAYLAFGVVRVDPLAEQFSLRMILPNSGGLEPNSPILRTGVKVGTVESVQTVDDGVEVRFTIAADADIPVDSLVQIESLSTLGEPYIQFRPRTAAAPFLSDGQLIDTTTVQAPVSIPEVSRLVTAAIRQLDPEAIGRFVDTFDQALRGTESIVPQLARSSELLAVTLLSRMPAIAQLLTELQSISPGLAAVGAQVESAAAPWVRFGTRVDAIAQAIERISNVGDTPRMYLEGNGLEPFLLQVGTYLDKIGPDLQVLAPALQPLAQSATRSIPTIDLGRLIEQALVSTSPDGRLKLAITVK